MKIAEFILGTIFQVLIIISMALLFSFGIFMAVTGVYAVVGSLL